MVRAATLILMFVSTPAVASPVGHYPAVADEVGAQGRANIVYALRRIPTAVGANAYDRIAACRFRIQWNASWVAREVVANTNFGLRPGDIVISIEFDRPASDPEVAKDNLARWFIRSGKLEPDTGWAREIQTGKYPINRDGLSRC